MTFDVAFEKLARSKFRSRFRLSDVDRKYIAEKGMETIRRHAEDFVRQKLAPAQPTNDGKQTPISWPGLNVRWIKEMSCPWRFYLR